ncbi:MAG: hypothetical protein ACRETL_01940 [Gammaproteobacteria bacterium]
MPKRYETPLKRSPKSDPQQYRVYRMELEAIGARQYLILTRPKIRRLLRTLGTLYHVPRVKVVFNGMTQWAAEWEEPNIIRIGAKQTSQDLLTALHEFAHHLHHYVAPQAQQQPHGPQFMCCYMSVLDTVRFLPISAMRAVCEDYEVKYIAPKSHDGVSQLARRIT